MILIDIKKAHLNGKISENMFVYVSLPERWAGGEGMRWRLKRRLYGMRPAASAWEADYSDKLGALGMAKGLANSTAFYHPGKEVRCVVHGDDFTFL